MLIALMGVVGLAAVGLAVIGGPPIDDADLGPAVFLLGFLVLLSSVMAVAGVLATRSNTTVLRRDADEIRWRFGKEQGVVMSGRARLEVRGHGVGHYRSFLVVFEDGYGRSLAEVSAGLSESVAAWQRNRVARALGLPVR
jgi:hypothetical protein